MTDAVGGTELHQELVPVLAGHIPRAGPAPVLGRVIGASQRARALDLNAQLPHARFVVGVALHLVRARRHEVGRRFDAEETWRGAVDGVLRPQPLGRGTLPRRVRSVVDGDLQPGPGAAALVGVGLSVDRRRRHFSRSDIAQLQRIRGAGQRQGVVWRHHGGDADGRVRATVAVSEGERHLLTRAERRPASIQRPQIRDDLGR